MLCMAWNPRGRSAAGALVNIESELQLRLALTSLLQAPDHERNLGEVWVVLMEQGIFKV